MTDWRIHEGDLVKWLAGREWLALNDPGYRRFHAIWADPPYSLISINKRFSGPDAAPAKGANPYSRTSKGFMGQSWDGFADLDEFQEWVTTWTRLALRQVYPGAYMALCGGSRTWHRLAAGIERAGWEITDVIIWAYGSGFPKSHNLEKTFKRLGNAESALHWRGYGSALKPAYEPIILARAPRAGLTFAQLADLYGVGALNIDGGRLGDLPDAGRWPANLMLTHSPECRYNGHKRVKAVTGGQNATETSIGGNGTYGGGAAHEPFHYADPDGLETVESWSCVAGCPIRQMDQVGAGASRFFYSGKAPAWEKCAGLPDPATNPLIHPTFKPLGLTEYIARLLLPPPLVGPRRILIPCSGVGSEVIGAYLAGWDDITGLEKESGYVAQSIARVKWWLQYESYNKAKRAYNHKKADAPNPAPATQPNQPTESDGPLQIPLF